MLLAPLWINYSDTKSKCRIDQQDKLTCIVSVLWQVYGLDINPRAIKVAWINLYLNAIDENGNYIYDREGKTLLDRVEFHESDLLAYCRFNNMQLDRIVGCIPQV